MKWLTEMGTEVESDKILVPGQFDPSKPVRHKAVGRLRLRIRVDCFPEGFLREANRIAKYWLADCGDHYELIPTDDMNVSVSS